MSRTDRYSEYECKAELCSEPAAKMVGAKLTEKLQETHDKLLKGFDILFCIRGKIFGEPSPGISADNGLLSIEQLTDKIGCMTDALLGELDNLNQRL